jgi:hypothetical protein
MAVSLHSFGLRWYANPSPLVEIAPLSNNLRGPEIFLKWRSCPSSVVPAMGREIIHPLAALPKPASRIARYRADCASILDQGPVERLTFSR